MNSYTTLHSYKLIDLPASTASRARPNGRSVGNYEEGLSVESSSCNLISEVCKHSGSQNRPHHTI